jgi:hypothetical protein
MFSTVRISAGRLAKVVAESGAKRNGVAPLSSLKNPHRAKLMANTVRRVSSSTSTASCSGLNNSHAKDQHARFSTVADADLEGDHVGPMGELFDLKRGDGIDESLVGKTASIRRVFGPSANAHGLLTCGGEELARHASFDPDYSRARGWIQNRAIGPAVLSPVIISGLVGALVEAAFPQSVPVAASMHQARPLIVGQEVYATVQVVGVKHYTRDGEEVSIKEKDFGSRQDGDEIQLLTEVVRIQDNEVIAEGSHSVWIPGYLSR